MPPSVNEWLPQRHLARFVVEVVDGLDPSAMSKSYRQGARRMEPCDLAWNLKRMFTLCSAHWAGRGPPPPKRGRTRPIPAVMSPNTR
jgi:hypothetical protein